MSRPGCDAVLPELLGVENIVSEDAVKRAFKAVDEKEGATWTRGPTDAAFSADSRGSLEGICQSSARSPARVLFDPHKIEAFFAILQWKKDNVCVLFWVIFPYRQSVLWQKNISWCQKYVI
jgi:hypothetical protein